MAARRRSGSGSPTPGTGSVAPGTDAMAPLGEVTSPPPGTTELGIDIIRVARITEALARFGDRFSRRILTPAEATYVRNRPETLAGRWAAKEAVSKVLGLGVRGVGWREIEVERLPTGQPTVRLHDRAARRAAQLGMGRVAVSISHEAEFAVAVAYGVRTAGGRFLLPPDIDERMDEREAALLRRLERLRGLAREAAAIQTRLEAESDAAHAAGNADGAAGDVPDAADAAGDANDTPRTQVDAPATGAGEVSRANVGARDGANARAFARDRSQSRSEGES